MIATTTHLPLLRAVAAWEGRTGEPMDFIALCQELDDGGHRHASLRADITCRLWFLERDGLVTRVKNGLWADDVAITPAGRAVVAGAL